MSKKRTPAHSGTASPSFGFGAPAATGFASSSSSVLSFIGEPPDLSQIDDPSVVALFKHFSKQEEVTKAKALDGLLAAVDAADAVEDPVLAAWVRLYPRLSIDVSARVRRLANTLQGALGAKAGRKLARHMPRIVGPWLAGLFDSDRSSAGATHESLVRVFKSPDKIAGIWKAYGKAVLEFCDATVTSESVNSLSDERWVKPDDAQAKFARVMATCASSVAHMLVSDEAVDELEESYRAFLGEKTLWTFAFHSDAFLRRSVYKLLLVVLEKRPEWVSAQLEMVSTALIVKASAVSQIGTVNVYLDTLLALTKHFPESWTVAKPSKKKSVLRTFISFVEQGSQMALPSYWNQVAGILTTLPKELLAEKEEAAKSVMAGVLNGIKAGPEPRTHMLAAWGCYWDVCYRFLGLQLPWPDFDNYILQHSIFQIYEGYLVGGNPKDLHIISHEDSVSATVCGSGLVKLDQAGREISTRVLNDSWKKVEGVISGIVRREREDTTSAKSVKACGERWVKLSVGVLKQLPKDGVVYEAVVESNVTLLTELIESLLATNGKVVGSAIILEQLLGKIGPQVLKDNQATASFFLEKMVDILESETVEHLLAGFVSYGAHSADPVAFQEAWKKTINALMMSERLSKEKKESAIILLLNSASSSLSGKVTPVPQLDSYVVNKMRSALPEAYTENAWRLVQDALGATGDVISQATTSKMLVELMENMTLDGSSGAKSLNALAGTNPHRLLPFINSNDGKELVSKLLVLANSPDDEVSSSAARLREVIKAASSEEGMGRLTEVTIDNICDSVREPSSEHLSIDYLAAKAEALVKEAPREQAQELTEKLLGSMKSWETAINPFLEVVGKQSLAITNPLGGCIFLVDDSGASEVNTTWDSEGYSTVLRMAMFSIKVITALEDADDILSTTSKFTLLRYILLVLEIAKDNLSIAGANELWKDHSPDVEAEVLEFTSRAQQWVVDTLKADAGKQEYSTVVVDGFVEWCGDDSAAAFYNARALSVAVEILCEHDQSFRDKMVAWVEGCEVWKSNDVFRSAAMLVGSDSVLTPSKKERVWTGLMGSLLGVTGTNASTVGLQQLVLLNAALPNADEGGSSIPQPRAMNLIRHLLAWLDEDNEEIELNAGLVVEIAKVLGAVLPIVKGMYGEHWQTVLGFVKMIWETCTALEEMHLPMVFSTLKLFQTLRSLQGENDDLDDAWEENRSDLYSRLLNLLQNSGRPDNLHQPRSIVNTQIARQLRDIDVALVGDLAAVYPLLGTQSRPIQKAAFDILHRYIPTTQEQLSVDVALSADAAAELQLPPEILSMIIETPEPADEQDIEFANEMPIAIRGYLFSWILVFDHFENASFKVKSIYVDALKEGNYITPLLDFISRTLFAPRLFDASKVSIQSYTPDTTESPLLDLKWLQTHLYYLTLRHTPSLVKSWWLDSDRNRATVLATESFTEKYMSPLLIDAELTAVTDWVHSQPAPTPGEEDTMTVKVSKAAKEVTASYPIDDQAMDVLVRLPAIFPLRQVEVVGLRRVGLDDRRFKQMQLASQAVVNFQSGTIIDALTLFRKNVNAHFQGITECAICYSILAVTPDRALPNRACATCKNKFHSTCLLKWFKTSNSSSCPLCRTSFSFYS